jgi:hypothetical protein
MTFKTTNDLHQNVHVAAKPIVDTVAKIANTVLIANVIAAKR